MLTRRKRPKMGVREDAVIRSESHKQFIRGFACALFGKEGHVCTGKIEAAHARTGTNGSMGKKPGDDWCLPLCGGPDGAHAEQHRLGESAFEKKYGIDMKAIAMRLANISPHLKKLKFAKGQ